MELLNQTRVKNNAVYLNMLKDLQANILKGHGRDAAWHIFLSVDAGQAADAQKWISDFAAAKLTTSIKQLTDTSNLKLFRVDGGPVFTLSLSASGYEKLGVDRALWPDDSAFITGMAADAGALSDNIDDWEPAFRERADIFVLIADSDETTVNDEKEKILRTLPPAITLLKEQRGKVLRNAKGEGIEHFGYADGISQPLFLEKDLQGKTTDEWSDKATLGIVLVPDKGGKGPDSFGSYLVFRKLEQNVKKFKDEEKKITVKDEMGNESDELAGAMLIGRFEDGTPTLVSDKEIGIMGNDFNYPTQNDKPAGESKCPFHAHIRVTNPRADVTDSFAKSVRITRRGIPFDEIGRGSLEELPEKGVGLLFMCYQSSITNQFRFIQRNWSNAGEVIPERFIGQDGIIGQGENNFQKALPLQWGKDAMEDITFSNTISNFVTMRGGEYFFTPSKSFLESVFTGSAAGAPQEALL